jgi:DNA-nicking Smr family endonuclease
MSRRRRHPPPPAPAKKPPTGHTTPFHAPFQGLGKVVRPRPEAPEPARRAPAIAVAKRKPPAGPAVAGDDDEQSFAAAMADVRPLRAEARVDAPAPTTLTTRTVVDEEAEALHVLSDLVAGDGHFDMSDSTEYVEGAVVGLDPRVLRRLRRGELAYQAIIDLHGMSAAAARIEVERFILQSIAAGHREVLIVHGRGRNSKDNVPVLKERLKGWLARGRIGRGILAFTSARPADGGTGALYVLLRRQRGPKERITVYDGAKRE